jgi:hypothetical protein
MSVLVTPNVERLCAGGEIAFHLPVTEGQFIDKSSLFILLLNVVRHAGTTADTRTSLMIIASALLAQNRMLAAVMICQHKAVIVFLRFLSHALGL